MIIWNIEAQDFNLHPLTTVTKHHMCSCAICKLSMVMSINKITILIGSFIFIIPIFNLKYVISVNSLVIFL